MILVLAVLRCLILLSSAREGKGLIAAKISADKEKGKGSGWKIGHFRVIGRMDLGVGSICKSRFCRDQIKIISTSRFTSFVNGSAIRDIRVHKGFRIFPVHLG